MMTTSAQIAVELGKVVGNVQIAELAKELEAIQSNTGMTIMSNWPFNFPLVPWTAKQIKEYEQQQRSQLPESPI
jgi:hypothetical protein